MSFEKWTCNLVIYPIASSWFFISIMQGETVSFLLFFQELKSMFFSSNLISNKNIYYSLNQKLFRSE